MSEPFLGQLQMFGFGFPPKGWARCDGQLLSIQQNTALFSLLGTMYGGNGTTNFALPDLRGRVPAHMGTDPHSGVNYVQGEHAGIETETLSLNELPSHNHGLLGTAANANDKRPKAGSAFAQSTKVGPTSPGDSYYAPAGSPTLTALNPGTVVTVGGNQPHTNIQPYLTVSWCIALVGIFPSRN